MLGVLFEVREEDNKEIEAIFKGERDRVSQKNQFCFYRRKLAFVKQVCLLLSAQLHN